MWFPSRLPFYLLVDSNFLRDTPASFVIQRFILMGMSDDVERARWNVRVCEVRLVLILYCN